MTSLQILGAIRRGTCYGLDIVTQTGLPSGTVYPTLGRLKRGGLVRARWEDQRIAEGEGRPRRRYYQLTEEGEKALARGMSQVAQLASELGAGTAGQTG
jgi:DNA-binding PadR family transcriptional regulator